MLTIAPWVLSTALAGLLVWAFVERAASDRRVAAMRAQVVALQDSLGEAEIARVQLVRQREANEQNLKNVFAGQEELKRQYDKLQAASDEVIEQTVNAMRQRKRAESALEGEQAARVEEQKQRVLVEAQKDSVAAQQRRTETANLRLQAS